MYNPPGDDNNHEFIEIYFEELTNLTNWIIADTSSNDSLSLLQFFNSSYALIVEEDFDYAGVNASIYAAGATIWNGLNNDGTENIFLYYPNGTLAANVSYSDSLGADGDGNSLQLFEGSWRACSPTPGMQNNCGDGGNESNGGTSDFELSYPFSVYNNASNFSVSINFQNFSGIYDIKIEIKNATTTLADIYDTQQGEWQYSYYYIEDVNITNSSFIYSTTMRVTKNYEGQAKITIKLRNQSQTLEKSYNITILKGTETETSTCDACSLEILSAPSKANFGELIDVEIAAYRCDTAKYAIYLYIENEDGKKASSETTSHLEDKCTNYTLVLPLQIKNCDGLDEGNYVIVLEGLDTRAEKSIILEGNCEESNENENESSESEGNYELVSFPEQVEVGEEFFLFVKLLNDENEKKTFTVWSYVYRGNKCYSCKNNREENNISIAVNSHSSEIIELRNVVQEAEEGNYSIKIKILKEGRKTPYELKQSIKIKTNKIGTKTSAQSNSVINETKISNMSSSGSASLLTGKVIYETALAKNIKIILLVVLAALILVFVLRQKYIKPHAKESEEEGDMYIGEE